MSGPLRLIALTAAAASIAGFALPTAAHAEQPCSASIVGSGGDTWDIASDGTLKNTFTQAGGSNFDAGHGKLTVNGSAYPNVADPICVGGATGIGFPSRLVGGLNVSRAISVSGGALRHIDSITNTTNLQKLVTIGFGIEVLPSQVSIASESGEFEVTKEDHWAVLENAGASNPFLQWGQKGNGAIDPVILSEGDVPAVWKSVGPTMPDAQLRYVNVPVPEKSTVSLLHISGSGTSQAGAVASAKDTLAPFAGLNKLLTSRIINWSNDVDGDGVSRFVDECPTVKGDNAVGCLGPQNPDPQNPPNPDPQNPDPQNPKPGNPGTVKDHTAPKVTITRLARTSRIRTLTRKGIAPRIACNEKCRITVEVSVRRTGRAKASRVLKTNATSLSSARRTVKIKVRHAQLQRLARKRLTVKITAVDAAGNRRAVSKAVTIHR